MGVLGFNRVRVSACTVVCTIYFHFYGGGGGGSSLTVDFIEEYASYHPPGRPPFTVTAANEKHSSTVFPVRNYCVVTDSVTIYTVSRMRVYRYIIYGHHYSRRSVTAGRQQCSLGALCQVAFIVDVVIADNL